MTLKQYNSFQEIDERLKILKLQQEIEKETLKLNFKKSKESLTPTHLLGGMGGLLQKVLISLFANKLLKKLRH